jgi:hypothetical protein
VVFLKYPQCPVCNHRESGANEHSNQGSGHARRQEDGQGRRPGRSGRRHVHLQADHQAAEGHAPVQEVRHPGPRPGRHGSNRRPRTQSHAGGQDCSSGQVAQAAADYASAARRAF